MLTSRCSRTGAAVALAALVAAPALAAPAAAHPAPDVRHVRHVWHAPHGPHGQHGHSAAVVLHWERVLMRTVYTEQLTPIPVGVPILGFTSVAMYDAVTRSLRRHHSSERAAVAAAAHGVMTAYLPAATASLDAELAATLAQVPDGAAERRGVEAGERAAAAMLARRAGDGWMDLDVHYDRPPGPGVWQPAPPATDMLAAWLGSLRRLVLRHPVRLDGPDPLHGRAYARDYEEVRRLGSATSTERTAWQTDTALFFNSNSATMVGDALVRRLEKRGIGLVRTARLFARIHAAMTDSVIQTWHLKREVGFWRPSEAIAAAGSDGNPWTQPEPGWAPLIANPPYSDYVSGHASLTAPAVQVIRMTLGERTRLELVSVNSPTPRVYHRLRALERDAFHARIWAGLHFRDAMVDGYRLGHETARRVFRAVR